MFSVRLKELREKAGYSQAQLALKLGVRQSTVGMWENGTNKPKNAKLEQLANIFGVTTDYILGRTDVETGAAPELSDLDYALSSEVHRLTDDEKQDVLDYMRFKRSQRKE